MDEFGMEMMVLSLNAPAVQAIPDAKRANEIARKANDYLAEQVVKNPKRFQALAALPLQDPDMAAKEMERCVKQLGMVGALANGFSQIGDPNTTAYLDEKQYWPFWDVVAKLSHEVYQFAPTQAHALANARAFAYLHQAKPAGGWLQTALEFGEMGREQILAEPEFQALMQNPEFREFIEP